MIDNYTTSSSSGTATVPYLPSTCAPGHMYICQPYSLETHSLPDYMLITIVDTNGSVELRCQPEAHPYSMQSVHMALAQG